MSRIPQNFKNHPRLNPLYHYFLSPLGGVLAIWGIYNAVTDFSSQNVFLALLGVAVSVSILVSRLFALKNQDRIIRLEMRFRYHLLTGKRLEPLEEKLGLARIIALRFASDAELPALLEAALKEELPPKEIKKRIGDWQGDYYRV